jgi:hypothetical protein
MRSLSLPEADLPHGLDALKAALGADQALTAGEEALLTAAYTEYQSVGGRAEVLRELADTLDGELPEANAEDISDFLQRAINRTVKRHGQGFWKVAVYRALSESYDFCAGAYRVLLQTAEPSPAVA